METDSKPRRRIRRDYDIFKGYAFYAPDVKGMIVLLVLLLLLGQLLGGIVLGIFTLFMSQESALVYGTLVSYPLQFLPPMMYCSFKSRQNAFFEKGIALDSRNVSPLSFPLALLLVVVLTVAMAFATDWINYLNYRVTTLLPFLEKYYNGIMNILKRMTGGPVWVSVLSVAIMAPFFEEWLCRGEVLRGLLQHMKPGPAIVVSALFFAVIHLNPWQALNAFIIGCVLGYIYYKTGSLVLTMVVHAVNNGLAVLMSNIDSLKDVEYFKDVLPTGAYVMLTLFATVVLIACLSAFQRIPLKDPKGNLDPVSDEIMP